jgi:outer membrane protein assembly factor BamB
MTLIELGDVSSGSPEPPPAPPRRVDVRRIAVAVVTVLCVLTVTGSVRPEPRGLPTLWRMSIGGDPAVLTADRVYVLGQGRTTTIRAHAAADGTSLWSRTLDRQAGWVNTDVPGVLLLPTSSGVLGDGLSPAVAETVALDPATGAVRWRQPGDVSVGTAESVLLVEWDPVRDGPRSMRMVRTADGTQVWALTPRTTLNSWTVLGAAPERPDRLVTMDRAGVIQVRRYADGDLLAEGAAPAFEVPRPEAVAQLYGAGPHLFVVRLDGVREKLTAYEVDTLRPRWERPGPLSSGVLDCGALICVTTGAGEVEALDPVTGAPRWRSSGWDYARPAGDGTLLVELYQGTGHGLVDEATGRELADFGPGYTVLDPDTGEYLGLTLSASLPPRLIVQQRDSSGTVIVRGGVPVGGDHGCQLAARRLACSGGGTLTVTDVG